jgi:ATP-dependent Lon protease
MAAHRGGIREILIPSENVKDLREIPRKVRAELNIIPVEHMDEVLRRALLLENPDTFLRSPETIAAAAKAAAVIAPNPEPGHTNA